MYGSLLKRARAHAPRAVRGLGGAREPRSAAASRSSRRSSATTSSRPTATGPSSARSTPRVGRSPSARRTKLSNAGRRAMARGDFPASESLLKRAAAVLQTDDPRGSTSCSTSARSSSSAVSSRRRGPSSSRGSQPRRLDRRRALAGTDGDQRADARPVHREREPRAAGRACARDHRDPRAVRRRLRPGSRMERGRPARADARPVRRRRRWRPTASSTTRDSPAASASPRQVAPAACVPHGAQRHARVRGDPGLRRAPRERAGQPEDRGDRARCARAAQGDGRRSSTRPGRCASGSGASSSSSRPRSTRTRRRSRRRASRSSPATSRPRRRLLRRDDDRPRGARRAYLPLDDRRDPRQRPRAARSLEDADDYAGLAEELADEDDLGRRSRGGPRAPRCSRIGVTADEAIALAQQAVALSRQTARTSRCRPTRSRSSAGCSRWPARGIVRAPLAGGPGAVRAEGRPGGDPAGQELLADRRRPPDRQPRDLAAAHAAVVAHQQRYVLPARSRKQVQLGPLLRARADRLLVLARLASVQIWTKNVGVPLL